MIVTLIVATSLDGKIAELAAQSSLAWTSKEDLQFFVKKTKEIGTLVMGRKTFQTIGKPLKDRKMYVLSYPGEENPTLEGVEVTTESPAQLADRLGREGVAGLAVCGGASVYSQFLSGGLVDEIFVTVEPYLFGSGIPLTKDFGRVNLAFVEMSQLGAQTVLLHYRGLSSLRGAKGDEAIS